LGVAGVVVLVFLAVAVLFPVPYLRLSPGPTFNTIGQYAGQPVIAISGHRTYPTSGHLDMLTVLESGGPFGNVYLGQVLQAWRDPDSQVLPREAYYPDQTASDQVAVQNQADFTDSQSAAVAAALHHLGIPVSEEVTVVAVTANAPADGKLEPGDRILSVGSTKVTSPQDVSTALQGKHPGDKVRIGIQRDGKKQVVVVTAGASPTNPAKPFLGVLAALNYVAPFSITFTLQDVGGPSAGMMFTLGLIDMLSPSALNGGHFVAGTGTMDAQGDVGPIGGIAQKLAGARDAGATFFLAPKANCADLAGHVPPGLTVAAVSTLDEALAALQDYDAGRPAPTCS
jgi:PDZ domain-containing protein